MEDTAPGSNPRHSRTRATAPVRRALTLASAVTAVGAAALLVLGVDCAIYLALSGEPPSLAAVLQQAPRWLCGLLRICSA